MMMQEGVDKKVGVRYISAVSYLCRARYIIHISSNTTTITFQVDSLSPKCDVLGFALHRKLFDRSFRDCETLLEVCFPPLALH